MCVLSLLVVASQETTTKVVPPSPVKSDAGSHHDTSFDPHFEPIIELPPEIKVVTGRSVMSANNINIISTQHKINIISTKHKINIISTNIISTQHKFNLLSTKHQHHTIST